MSDVTCPWLIGMGFLAVSCKGQGGGEIETIFAVTCRNVVKGVMSTQSPTARADDVRCTTSRNVVDEFQLTARGPDSVKTLIERVEGVSVFMTPAAFEATGSAFKTGVADERETR
ncbi:MAG: hypothetical protein ACRDVP_12030 [Acidimicrobiales bacterium]